MKNKLIKDFIDELKSKSPTPGGGGASALVGAIGLSLGNMVGSLTVGKKKYADVEDDIKALMAKSETLIEELLDLINKDAEAFAPLAAAYSLPKETEEEIAHKEEVMAKALLIAIEPPLEIMRKCAEGIDLVEEYAAKGSRLAISDAGVAAIALRSALMGASLNVFINTGSMKDRECADALNAEANELIAVYGKKAEDIFTSVKDRL